MYVYILYLRRKDTIHTCNSLHGSSYHYSTVAGEWLNSLIFHNGIKCITANGKTIIYVSCHMTIIHFVPKILRSTK